MIPKLSTFSSVANSQLLEAGARSGFDSVAMGSAIGGAAGAINGSFSDYEGVFSGAMKGAIVGGIGGAGLKMTGSKYAANYEKKVSQFTNAERDVRHTDFQKNHFGLDTKLFGKNYGGLSEDASLFNDEFGGGLAALRGAGRDLSNARNGTGTASAATSPFNASKNYSSNNFTNTTGQRMASSSPMGSTNYATGGYTRAN